MLNPFRKSRHSGPDTRQNSLPSSNDPITPPRWWVEKYGDFNPETGMMEAPRWVTHGFPQKE